MPSRGERGVVLTVRRSLLLGMAFLLSCTADPDPEPRLALQGELVHVKGMDEKELQRRFAEKGAKVRVVDTKQDGGSLLLIQKGDRDSLPVSLRKLQEEASLKRVGPSSAELPGQKSIPSDLAESEPPSGMGLPDIFDIFTRIY